MTATNDAYYDLGHHQRPVTTNSEDAQLWFNRGLIWTYGFNHEEAALCFEKAIAFDDGCALAYWGLAYALGPNYNKPWEFFDPTELAETVRRTHLAVKQATDRTEGCTPLEKALIHAIQARYPKQQPDKDCSVWNRDYAEAMVDVYREFPDDLDVATLCVEALMNLTPWKMWDLKTGRPAENARTVEAERVLERALAQNGGMKHPGLLHLYIHLMEMSPTPEAAQVAADHLRGLVPDSGHLQHMPTHIDVIVGHYSNGITSNQLAIAADAKFLVRSGALNFYTIYRMHDFHFCIYSAMFAGQSKIALNTVAQLEGTLSDELLGVKSPPMADWLEGFLAMRVHVLVRFGRWNDIVNLELPDDRELYSVTVAMTHYAKAIAYSATGEMGHAKTESELFAAALKLVPDSRMLFNNKCSDILRVGEAMMQGELHYRQGLYEEAFTYLRDAIAKDDALPFDEPWGWMQPTRHAYGALLLEQGHFKEAASVYAEDLGFDDKLPRPMRHPGNVWALHGYHECLVKLGRTKEAESIAPQLKEALQLADVPIKSSCFCRLETED